jgi:hypothetical protein
MTPILVTTIIFYSIYMVLKNFTDYSLKKMIIKSGHVDNAAILDQQVSSANAESREVNRYPSLKWGLVAFFAGMGLIFIDQMSPGGADWRANGRFMDNSVLPLGVEMVAISFGFILYFLIVNFIKKK